MEAKITIIYVFGPKKCYEDYQNNICLDTDGTWVKIGQTNMTCSLSDFEDISCLKKNIYNKSLCRIKQEVRTGISVTTKLYDAYIFPHESRKTDGEIRDILCKDLYSLENSKANNKNLDEDDIPAGEEFVYGVCKKNIQNAINNYVSIALLRCNNKNYELLCNCNKFNNFVMSGQLSEIIKNQESNDSTDRKVFNYKPSFNELGHFTGKSGRKWIYYSLHDNIPSNQVHYEIFVGDDHQFTICAHYEADKSKIYETLVHNIFQKSGLDIQPWHKHPEGLLIFSKEPTIEKAEEKMKEFMTLLDPIVNECYMEWSSVLKNNNNQNRGDNNLEKSSKRKSRMNHDLYLQIGEKLFLVKNQKYGADKEHIYVRDNDGRIVECEYIGGNKFKGFDGTIGSSSTLANMYIRQFANPKVTTCNGNEHWEYNGKRLIDYRID